MGINIEKKNVFITSNPGVGKTRLIKELCMPYIDHLGGFYTEEIRESSATKVAPTRMGFKLKTFSGEEGIFAYKGMRSQYKLNKYGIDLKVLEELGVKSMLEALEVENKKLIVIDEIGTMECYSRLFRETLVKCLNSAKSVLATIRYKSQPFTDEIKRLTDTQLILLTRENYPDIKALLRRWLEKIIPII